MSISPFQTLAFKTTILMPCAWFRTFQATQIFPTTGDVQSKRNYVFTREDAMSTYFVISLSLSLCEKIRRGGWLVPTELIKSASNLTTVCVAPGT